MTIQKHFSLFANPSEKNTKHPDLNKEIARKNNWQVFVNDFRTIYLKNGRAFYVGSNTWSFDADRSPYSITYDPVEIKLPNHRRIMNIKAGGGNTFLQDDQGKWFGFGFIFQKSYWSKRVPVTSDIHALPPIQGHQIADVVPEFNVFYKTDADKWYAQGSNYNNDLGMVKDSKKWFSGERELPEPQQITLPWNKKITRIENGHGNNFFYDGKDWYCSGNNLHFTLKRYNILHGIPFKINFPDNIQIKKITSTNDIAIAEDNQGNFYISDNDLYMSPSSERINSHFSKLMLPNHEAIKNVYTSKDCIIILSKTDHCYQIGRLHTRNANNVGGLFEDFFAPTKPGIKPINLPQNKKVEEVYLSSDHAIFQTKDGQLYSLGSGLGGVKNSEKDPSIAIPLDGVIQKLNDLVDEKNATDTINYKCA